MNPIPPPPPPPAPPPSQAWQYPQGPPGSSPGTPPYGYGAPAAGWAFAAPTYAARLGREAAGFGARLGACVIDALILTAISIPLWIVSGLLIAAKWDTKIDTCTDRFGDPYLCEVPTGSTVGWMVLIFGGLFLATLAIAIIYWGKYEGQRGQTPGKKIAGIRTMDQVTGQPIGFGRAVGRLFARYISSMVLYLGYLWMLWDDNNQTWHDKIVKSIVVKE